ncbi:MAG: hypothetical protein ACI9R3_000119 [Verrucomicrobiales bacterium]|jgi:hypothetical protein
MPVLSDNTSVIVKNASIAVKFPGGIAAFASFAGNSFCTDGKLARVGFESLQEAIEFICKLADHGLNSYSAATKSADDMVVARKDHGFAFPCDWAEFGYLDVNGDPTVRVPACRSVGCKSLELSAPQQFSTDMKRNQVTAVATAISMPVFAGH